MRRIRLTTAALLSALLLASCTSPTTPPPSGSLDLEGLWLVTAALGTEYGAGGTTTLEFGSAPSGAATFLSRATTSGVTTCEQHVYAAVTNNVVLLDGVHYEASATGQDRIDLVDEFGQLTLTRVTGAPPVAPCLNAQAVLVGTLAERPGSWGTLDSHQTRLYFNTAEVGNPVVAFDTVTGLFGAGRIYTGNHDHVIAARNDSEFYGHCACGNITTLERFNIDTNTALTTITSTTDLGLFMTMQKGLFTGSAVMVSGTAFDQPGTNAVFTLDPDTLALQSQREVLPGEYVPDLAWNGSHLVALIANSIVIIANDGQAESTVKLAGNISEFPRGLTYAAGTFYVLDETGSNTTAIYRIDMP